MKFSPHFSMEISLLKKDKSAAFIARIIVKVFSFYLLATLLTCFATFIVKTLQAHQDTNSFYPCSICVME